MFDNDSAERKAGNDDGNADLNNSPDLGVKVFVGNVFEINLDDVGYANDANDYITAYTRQSAMGNDTRGSIA